MESNKHFNQIDFIRAVCCIGIILYHFSCHTASNLKPLYETINSNIGGVIVTIFFIVSGFVLYHSNQEIKSLKEFYYKRFKSIFPSFYICWFIFYVLNVIKVRTPFYAGNPLKLLLTLIGQDGYTQLRIVNYYTVGEWFLGALIFVYALYPLLLKIFKKNDLLGLIALIVLTSIVYLFNIPVLSPGFPGICESCLKFYMGMMIYKYMKILNDKKVLLGSLIFFILYTFVKINVLNTMLDMIYGLVAFILLYKIGEKVNLKCINEISSISYQIFLFQQQVIIHVLEINNPSNITGAIIALLICVILTVICAQLLKKLVNRLYKTNLYIKFENAILGR